MEFYVSIDGNKEGPYSLFKIGDMLEEGKITEDTLAWHRDLEEWKPIRDVEALKSVIPRKEPPPEMPPLPEKQEREPSLPPGEVIAAEPVMIKEVRPFTRFWARMFDYLLVSVFVFLVSDVNLPQPEPSESAADFIARYIEEMQNPETRVFARTQVFALLGWHFLEGVLILLFGVTPGKALMGVRVVNDLPGKLSFLRSIARSYYVYVLGVGFYLFPFMLIGMVFGFFRLLSSGSSVWDTQLKIRVETKRLSAVRIMLAIGAFFALFLLQSLKIT